MPPNGRPSGYESILARDFLAGRILAARGQRSAILRSSGKGDPLVVGTSTESVKPATHQPLFSRYGAGVAKLRGSRDENPELERSPHYLACRSEQSHGRLGRSLYRSKAAGRSQGQPRGGPKRTLLFATADDHAGQARRRPCMEVSPSRRGSETRTRLRQAAPDFLQRRCPPREGD